MQNHGFLALYRGLTPTLISAFPKAGIRFGSNAHFKKMLMDDNGKLTPGKNFLAGVGAGESREGREGGRECGAQSILMFKKLLMDENGKLTPGKNFLVRVGAGEFEGGEGGREGEGGSR